MIFYDQALGDIGKEKLPINRKKLPLEPAAARSKKREKRRAKGDRTKYRL